MTTETIFQVTDLSSKRVEFVCAARSGGARLRDKDGTSLLMLPESRVLVLEGLAAWSDSYIRLERLVRRGQVSVSDLGDLAWLRVFDTDDLRAFLEELDDALVSARADGSLHPVEELVADWRRTASQLDDPLRRSVLLDATSGRADLVEAERPK